MKILFTVLALSSFSMLHAQNLSITAFGGFANYQGDLQDKRFTTAQSHGAFGAGVLYELTDHFSARANFTIGKIGADDAQGRNKDRNLNFTSSISDYHLGIEYNIFNIYDKGFTPYLFAGVSYFHFDPYTRDTAGTKYYLQPLGTEGQGFYEGRQKYKLNQLAIPFGGGLKLALGDNIRIGVEVGLRKTNTDYLDDVSSTYADQTELTAHNGAKAAELAFRGDELKPPFSYPAAGAQRGSPKQKDWYYFSGVTLSFRLHGNDAGSRKGLGCPGAVR